uniref:TIR domain-containing protein n=2 Tax=Pyxicephalus adspersus TaxID=30357 RepID=A0AAV2ZGG2_PYXAD|nr:TPA: hypothetical protein GDO54_003383 [Pyxicephalus adspersus]
MILVPPITAFGYAKCFLVYENREYANCIGQGVETLQESIQHLPNQTLWLNVSYNSITVVEHKAFSHLPRLLELRLNRNKINAIHSGAFDNLNNLYHLDLSHNLIQSLENVDMKDLTSLQILNLSKNRLRTMESVRFISLKALQELDLSFNQISDFSSVVNAVTNLNTLYILNMSSNSIADLRSNQTLLVLSSLNILDLKNNSISVLDFSQLYMPNLTTLNVRRNNMTSINKSAFINVPNLSDITFNENPLNISILLHLTIPKLTELHWSSMRPALEYDPSVTCQVFQSFPKLQVLDIQHSKINISKLHIIGGCTNLTSLILSTSSLRNLTGKELQAFKNLEVLYLDKCKIENIQKSTWLGLESLRTLTLERNKLSYLQDFLFSPLKNLQYLDLSKNHFIVIKQNLFVGLKHLTHLILRGGNIVAISASSFLNVRNLKYLDIQENNIFLMKMRSFHTLKKLETLLLSGNKIHSINLWVFQGLNSLRTLSLSNNFIYKISDDKFTSLKSLEYLNISRNMLSFFNEKDAKRPFEKLKLLKTLDISYQSRRYEDIAPETLFEGLSSLKNLNMKGISVSGFMYVSFSPLTNLTNLDLSESFQGSDQDSTVEFIYKFPQVRHLTLDNNKIKDLPGYTFANLKFLENLSIRNNKLRNISKTFLTHLPNLSYFDAYMNPLSCSCDNYWFQEWSQWYPKVQVPLIQSYNCFGQVAHDLNFVNQDLSFCGTDISVFFFIGSFILTLLFMVTSLVMMKLKWSIHYFYYMARVWFEWKLQKEDRIYKYDAYISYCSDDEEWVMKELLFHLECQGKRKYKICFKPRDFIPGVYHIDNIQDAINNSRKTLCVISRNYLESQWCRMEIEMACSKVFYQRQDVLLVIFLENIPDYR